ncbi:MAG: HEPN domain-containing protein [Patescibacteria group bacterium]|nr:HEPN domain-containing protein [Patescibacteria group bacterium]
MGEFEKTIGYYESSSAEDWKIAQKLFDSKDYSYCLFFCHLALEKLLKAVVVKKVNEHPPFTHFLARLAELAELPLDEVQIADLNEITKFNIATRYEDDKREFRKLATKTYAEKYLAITETFIQWLKQNYLNR